MNPELQNAIAELVKTITAGAKGTGNALQNIAPQAWSIVVRQVQITAIANVVTWVVCGIGLLLISYFTLGRFVRLNKEKLKLETDKTPNEAVDGVRAVIEHRENVSQITETLLYYRFAFWGLNFVGIMIIIGSVSENAAKILNPGYEAGINIIELARNNAVPR